MEKRFDDERGEGMLEKGLLQNELYTQIQPDSPLSAIFEKKSPKQRQRSPLSVNTARAKSWGRELIRPLTPLFRKRAGSPARPLRRTAYLDGLRGFAAFMVYWQHHQLWAHEGQKEGRFMEAGFGYQGKYYLACFHGLRTFFTGGHFAVTVFFVISGCVLSDKPMRLIHSGEMTKLTDNLASALFRRWMRLYIPVMTTTFMFMTFCTLFGIWSAAYERQRTYGDEIWKWYAEFKNFSYVFRTGGEPWFTYNFHVWSIPVEFKGSIVIYTSLLAFSRLTRNARLWCQIGLIIYLMYVADGALNAMFVCGMLLCDLDLLAHSKEDDESGNTLPWFLYKFDGYKELIFHQLFIISIFLGGVPSSTLNVFDLRATPGWYYLSFLKPQAVFDYKWFYLFWAATFLVASVPRIPWLKSFFEIPFNQYLGRISFAFYLVHGPVLWVLGDRMYAATGWHRDSHTNIPGWIDKFPLPKGGPLGLELAFLLPHLILLPVTLALAEVVTRGFDTPSVKFAQWLYAKMLPRNDR